MYTIIEVEQTVHFIYIHIFIYNSMILSVLAKATAWYTQIITQFVVDTTVRKCTTWDVTTEVQSLTDLYRKKECRYHRWTTLMYQYKDGKKSLSAHRRLPFTSSVDQFLNAQKFIPICTGLCPVRGLSSLFLSIGQVLVRNG